MPNDHHYKNLIFTHHALSRMSKRSISKDSVWRVLQYPDSSKPESKQDTTRFIRTINNRTYHIIGTYLPKEKKTLIVSAWVRGEEDSPSLVWYILTLPFKLIVWVIKKLFFAH